MAAFGGLQVDSCPPGKRDEDMEDKAPNCSICLEPVVQGASRSTAQLACAHHFHLDCIGSAFNAKGAMECPNCRRVEDGNWLMLGGSQSTDDAIYDVPYDFDDEEYMGLPVDTLDSEMREYMEAGRDISYTTHPYHPPGVICEFCEQHYCDENPCPHIIQCPYFFSSNMSQSGSTENPFSSSVSSMEAEAYAEAVAELYHEYRGPAPFSAPPPSTTPRHAPQDMHTTSSSTDSNYVYYFSSTPGTWQGGSSWGESNPPSSSWASGWQQQDRRQEAAHTTTFVQSSTMITTFGSQPAVTPNSFPPPPSFPPASLPYPQSQAPHYTTPPLHLHSSHSQASPQVLSPRTPLPSHPPFSNRQPFSETPSANGGYPSLRYSSESNPSGSREAIRTSVPPVRPGPLTYAGVLGRRQQPPPPPRRSVTTPQERPAGQPWRPVSDIHTASGGASGRHSGGHSAYCPFLGGLRNPQGPVAGSSHQFSQPDAGRPGFQQGLPMDARGQFAGGGDAQGAEGLLAMLELNDGAWRQDRNNLLMCSYCMDPTRPRFQTERRFVNRDALSQHMRAVHGVQLDRFSARS